MEIKNLLSNSGVKGLKGGIFRIQVNSDNSIVPVNTEISY